MKQAKILIYGTVQGVFFRKFVKDNAVNLGVKGYVKNLDDGSVEAVLIGEEEKVEELIIRCWKGPDGSKVVRLVIKNLLGDIDFPDFQVLH
ncbi:MAG: acylphosphatase [archaeon]